MLPQHDILTEANLRIGVKATLSRKSMLVRDTIEIVMLKIGNRRVGDAYTIGTNLLVVAHHHHLF